jgi:Flp pilus assembly protein TadG
MVRLSALRMRRAFRPAAKPPRPTEVCSERGSVTAETAIVLPAVVAVLAMLLAGATAGSTQLQLEKAAQTAARQLARGESGADAASAVRRIAGSRAVLASGNAGGWITVEVSATVPGPWAGAGGWKLTAEASAPAEPHAGSGRVP